MFLAASSAAWLRRRRRRWGSATLTQMRVEIEGSADEVVRVLRQLGSVGRNAPAGGDSEPMEMPAGSGEQAEPATGTPGASGSDEAAAAEWTEALVGEFLAGLEPAARRMARHVWRAGEVGIHRSALCQRAELTPAELRSLLMRMGHALRRFQQERGLKLPRPVAANSPLQSYFVDANFAAAVMADVFGDMGSP